MKKISTFLFTVLFALSAFSQAFFLQTQYKGAFGPAGSTNWTSPWANWDPETTVYPATNVTVQADITSNTTWTTGQVVELRNKVYVTNGATLTIQPGVVIRGDKNTQGTLIITKGAKIIAEGTPSQPIVFTSNQAVGSRNLGDWGGLIILGLAPNNQPNGTAIIEGGLDPVKGSYGGTNANDDSGILKYVRIEFGGVPFQPDQEINGLTMGSVGAQTKIEYVQVSFNNDDAFEWFGGNVNCKYLISFRNLDDDFDSDFGWSGKVQFGLIVRDPNIADQSAGSTSEGFESDNDAGGTNATPQTSGVFSNITLIGPYRGNTSSQIDAKFRRALRIRRNSAISIFNSIFTDFPTGLHYDGSASQSNFTSGNSKFVKNVIAGMSAGNSLQNGTPSAVRTLFAQNNDTLVSTSGLFVNPYPNITAAPDYRLAANSVLLSGADFTDSKLGTVITTATVTTAAITAITPFTASASGSVAASGNGTVTEMGVVYSVNANPTITNTKKIAQNPGLGNFTLTLTGLNENTTYYVRAYAINEAGVAYGNEQTFTTTTASTTLGYFVQTTYRGAFGPAGSNDWTEGWANWDPENTAYPATNVTVSSDITADATWTTGQVVELRNKVYVTNGAKLTIQPGVIIRGDKNTQGTLIITKGSQIIAQGTKTQPIVFTSNQAVGSRNLGDWGGVIILGNATNNQPNGTAIIEGGLDPVKGTHGGTDDNDNSGVFSFCRIEFGGVPFQPDQEINGLTMGSVGRGTKIDHVQVSFNNDDAFEWFGGTVNCRYIISFRNLDDDFDSDFGWRGNVQFGLIVRDPNIADQSAGSTSEGFESDNDAGGTAALPQTAGVFSNITVIGPYRGNTSNSIDAKFRRAVRIRRNSSISIFNSILTDFPTGLHIDGSASVQNATVANSLRFKNNLLAGMSTGNNLQNGSSAAVRTWFSSNANDTLATTTGIFVNPYPNFGATPDYRLAANSPLLTGASFTDSKFGLLITLPQLVTATPTNVDITTATIGGALTSNSNGIIAERGLVYGTNNNPTINDTKVVDAAVTLGSYEANITNLTGSTTYFVRAYAENEAGVNYGDEESFTTLTVGIDDNGKQIKAVLFIANNQLYIKGLSTEVKVESVQLFDLSGKLVYQNNNLPSAEFITIPLQQPLNTGIYLFNIVTNYGIQSAKVFVK
jgi:hypothetical protein